MYRRILLALPLLALVALAGCADKPDRDVAFRSHDFAWSGLDGFSAKAGETVRFSMTNDGPADHEFEVFGPDGKAIKEIEPVHEGETGKVTIKLAKAGTYTYKCGVSDHEARGMTGTFVVA